VGSGVENPTRQKSYGKGDKKCLKAVYGVFEIGQLNRKMSINQAIRRE